MIKRTAMCDRSFPLLIELKVLQRYRGKEHKSVYSLFFFFFFRRHRSLFYYDVHGMLLNSHQNSIIIPHTTVLNNGSVILLSERFGLTKSHSKRALKRNKTLLKWILTGNNTEKIHSQKTGTLRIYDGDGEDGLVKMCFHFTLNFAFIWNYPVCLSVLKLAMNMPRMRSVPNRNTKN